MRRFLPLLASFLLVGTAQAGDLSVGDPAPGFVLPDQDGEARSLADYRGDWVVLYFYPKDDTPGCTTEACSFRDNINRLIAQNAVVLGVSMDDVASHAAFAAKYELPFPLLADPEGKVVERYGALSDFLVVRFAKRQTFIIGPDGNIARIYRKVDPDEHVKEVLDDLEALQGG
ncbi:MULTISPECIES: peroxiredoxin [unclassified Guyparkeria]|uniref:peroxiredoxin n=1 Tax=unclassified Guyparkeria TaxID=2626246 RepID=UPI0007336711|nr:MULTISPECIES: peroxiredoxin [unclassified Guyparkeria]KTG16674.1 alkyl hydroperoxide reductase [Guyparkeria sp. XI15]OAE85708.1 alkyl hydroperoxide reductase [Guyparkeria sp. WRN-7]